MVEYVTLTCPTCGASLKASANASPLACAYCGNEHILRPNEATVAEGMDGPPDPEATARQRGEIAALEEQIQALALAILQREYRQGAAALVPLGKLTLRELKALLATKDPAGPARLIAALTIDELPAYAEKYQGSPFIMTSKRRQGVEDIARLIALRLQVEARRRAAGRPNV